MNYFKHFPGFVSAVSGCVLISAFASLIGVTVGIVSSVVGRKTLWSLQELKSICQYVKKKRKKHDKTVLLAKTELNTIEALMSKVLIDSYICFFKIVLGML